MSAPSLLLDAPAVRTIVKRIGHDALMDRFITRLRRAIAEYDPTIAQVPARSGVHYQRPEWGLLEWMPAYFGTEGTTVKLVGYHPSNPERRGLPTVISTVCVFSTESGHLSGLVDGTLLTTLRTGAASTVASEILAIPESAVLGVIGCGAQAVTQVHGLSRQFPLQRVLAYDIDPAVSRTFRDRLRFLDVPIEAVPRERLAELVASADILSTCTSAAPGEGPVFADGPHKPHLHVNAVGSDFHGKFEIPIALLRRSLVCPDFYDQAVLEGECQQLEPGEIGPDFRTLVQRAPEYASAQREVTVFDSTGWALEDHVGAMILFECAAEFGVGRSVELECLPADPKDPYSLLDASDALLSTAVAATQANR
jgi:ornithine cyclodeaminase/alanine dehydrogenase-like protein (mu-crystallin family)